MKLTAYRCRACGAELFLTYRDAAEHLIGCEQADPQMRRLAQEWLDAGAPTEMQANTWGGRRRAARPAPAEPGAPEAGT